MCETWAAGDASTDHAGILDEGAQQGVVGEGGPWKTCRDEEKRASPECDSALTFFFFFVFLADLSLVVWSAPEFKWAFKSTWLRCEHFLKKKEYFRP